MNERIRELAQQAGYYLYDLTEIHSLWYKTSLQVKTVETDEKNEWITLEKFAELIVRECAGVGYEASYSECALNVSNKILEHFGVE